MADPMDKIVDAYSNNRDWAVKAYQVGNQYNQVQGQLKEVEIQRKAQQLAIGEKIQKFMTDTALMPEGPMKKATIKQFQEGLAQSGVAQISPENIAALSDPNYRGLFGETAVALGGIKGTPEGDRIAMGLPGMVSSENVVSAMTQLRANLEKTKRSENKAASESSIINNLSNFFQEHPDLAKKYGLSASTPQSADWRAKSQIPGTREYEQLMGYSEAAGARKRADAEKKAALEERQQTTTEQSLANTQKQTEAQIAEGQRNRPNQLAISHYRDSGAAAGLPLANRTKTLRESGFENVGSVTDDQLLQMAEQGDEKAVRALNALTAQYIGMKDKKSDKDVAFEREHKLRNDFSTISKQFGEVINAANEIDRLIADNSPAAQNQLVGVLQILRDKGANAVREADLKSLGGSKAYINQIQSWLTKGLKGTPYTPADLRDIKKLAITTRNSAGAGMKTESSNIASAVKRYGVASEGVFGNYSDFIYGKAKADTLKGDTSFDAPVNNRGSSVQGRPAAGASSGMSPAKIEAAKAQLKGKTPQQIQNIKALFESRGASKSDIQKIFGGK